MPGDPGEAAASAVAPSPPPRSRLIVVTAPWCRHCRAMEADLVAASSRSGIPTERVDVASAPERAREIGVRGTPTIILVREGEEVARHVGRLGLGELEAMWVGGGEKRGVRTETVVRSVTGVALVCAGLLVGAPILTGVGVAALVWAVRTKMRS